MGFVKWILLSLAVVLAGCAQQPVQDSSTTGGHQTIDYTKYVQGPVPWFHFTSLYSWDSNQTGYVVVWTSPVQAYRLTLVGPCLGLQSAAGVIGLTSQGGEVSSTRDAVIAGGDHCKIMQIERLDARAIRAARAKSKPNDAAADKQD